MLALTMERAPVNAINREWINGFEAVLDELEHCSDVTVLLVRSSQRTFSAGADLKLMRDCFATEDGPDAMVETVRRMQRLYDRIEAASQVVIAEIGGAAHGGGFELALACDLRVAAEGAPLGLPETRLGLLPGAGGTQRMSRLCGPGVARRMILTAEVISGAQALRLGLVQWAVPADELEAFARALAERVATMSPKALAACKRCFSAADAELSAGMLIELLETHKLLNTGDTRGRIAAFLDR
ncbi:enoyl-CoA hydratase/isomerase family protein [Phreatobacter sp.]|uniref:enoyl-CoA hydratase/isomerase family protein n=1 Tax=Phreatobacter sp. TaxID=1966341 RepID=UPI0025CEEA1E|nr:enoyl-CoA hydratase/isomerase family protein [Phreatobacter sp.]